MNDVTFVLSIISIIGAVLNAKQNVYGFYIWIFSNAGWIIVDIYLQLWGQIPFFVVCFFTSFYGIITWNKKQKEVEQKCQI